MKQHEEVFFSVLRTALWKQPLEILQGFKSWGAVMMMAKTQALTGLVADVMLTTPEILDTLSEPVVQKLQDIPLQNMAMHTMLNNTLILVVTTLRNHGIEPVLLKGQGVARYYPIPELRQCGDIDLYVGEENYVKAYDALLSVVTEIDDKESLSRRNKHFHAKVGSVLIEVHQFADVNAYSKLNEVFQEYSSAGLTEKLVKVDFGGISINTPADDFNAFYVFNHMWHHFIAGGVGLRQLCDWAMFLHTHYQKLNLGYLESLLNDMQLMKPWQSFGCLAVNVLGLPEDEMPFYQSTMSRKSDAILKRIITEGNFGHQTAFVRQRNGGYLQEKWFSFRFHVVRYFRMFQLFPIPALRQFLYVMKSGFRQVFKDLSPF